MLPLFLGALALVVFVSAPVLADDTRTGNTHEGIVVSVTGDKLVMKGTGTDAAEYTHTLSSDATVTCDGKTCTLSDLKPGMKVRVTTKSGDKAVATKVEALDKNTDFDRGR
jgi:hypothetical protein